MIHLIRTEKCNRSEKIQPFLFFFLFVLKQTLNPQLEKNIETNSAGSSCEAPGVEIIKDKEKKKNNKKTKLLMMKNYCLNSVFTGEFFFLLHV